MIIRNKLLKRQNSSSCSKVYQHTKEDHFLKTRPFVTISTSSHGSPFLSRAGPCGPASSVYPLPYRPPHIHHTLNKDSKESLLILKLSWTLISQKEKDTFLSLGVCCSDCFCRSARREVLSLGSYPSLFRGEIELSFWERRTPKPYLSPPILSSPKKMICIHVSFWDLSKSAFDICYLGKWL